MGIYPHAAHSSQNRHRGHLTGDPGTGDEERWMEGEEGWMEERWIEDEEKGVMEDGEWQVGMSVGGSNTSGLPLPQVYHPM